jgi:cell division protein ZapD
MQLPLTDDTPPPTPPQTVSFEQPLNERLRTFLRLEFLYQQAIYHRDNPNPWSMRAAIQSLLEIFAITSRGDPKADVIKDLERRLNGLREYQNRPGVDADRLQTVIHQLQARREALQSTSTIAIARLRDNDLLAAIKHRSTIPGGTCEFDLPGFTHWLRLSDEARRADFSAWLDVLRPLCETVQDLLWLTRESERTRSEMAREGNFHLAFERDAPMQMLRITLPADCGLHPEVSAGLHRCSIRFLRWVDAQTRAVQTTEDVPFVLGFCN